MYDYKSEVFLIKGKYYTFTQNHMMFPLIQYGAVEGGITIDETVPLRAFDEICADVLIMRHGSKWGLFPTFEITGQGCADWASINDTPFIYDSIKILSYKDPKRFNESFDSFILLKEQENWKAVRIEKGRGSEIELPLESGLESSSDSFLIEQLEQKYGVKFDVHDVSISSPDKEEPKEFDVFKDFKWNFWGGDEIELLRAVIGNYEYELSMPYLYAAAHKDEYATLLIGKSLLKDVPKKRVEKDANGKDLIEFDDTILERSVSYLELAKKYADEVGNKTISDIARVYLDEARHVHETRHPRPLSDISRLIKKTKK